MNDLIEKVVTNDWFKSIFFLLLGSSMTTIVMWYNRRSLKISNEDLKKSLIKAKEDLQNCTREVNEDLKKSFGEQNNLLIEFFGHTSKLVDGAKPKLWSDFTGNDFKSYNDPWIMELINTTNDFIEIHRKRYLNPNCATFNFLFFAKDNRWDPFKRFVKFQAMVHLKLELADTNDDVFVEKFTEKIARYKKDNNEIEWQNTIKNINVFFNKKLERPFMTFFRGYKNDRKLALLYLSIKEQENRPHMTIQITDEVAWDRFDETWDTDANGVENLNGIGIFDMYLTIKDL